MTVGRHGAEVAGVIPSVMVEGFLGGILVLVVAEHDIGAACHNLAWYVLGVAAQDFHFHVAYGSAATAGLEVVPVAESDERGTLRGTITGGDGEVDALEESLNLLV